MARQEGAGTGVIRGQHSCLWRGFATGQDGMDAEALAVLPQVP